MTTTTYIISLSKTNHRIVRTNDERNQATTPLSKDMAPAHTAFQRGTDDAAIRAMAKHPSGRSWRTLEDLIEDSGLDADEANTACVLGAPFGSAKARAQYA